MAEVDMTRVPEFASLEIIKVGSTTIPAASDGTDELVTINHNLGYVPILIAFINNSGTEARTMLPSIEVYNTGANAGKVYQNVYCFADSTSLYFINQSQLQGTSGGNIKYYLFRERSSV